MVDTIHAYLNQKLIDEYIYSEPGLHIKTNVKESIKYYEPELPKDVQYQINNRIHYSYVNPIDNFLIKYIYHKQEFKSIRIEGSLPKLVYTTNYRKSDILSIGRGIVSLQQRTKLPIWLFRVTRLDLALNIEMDYPTKSYIKTIDHLPGYRLKKFSKHSVIYQHGSKSFSFYDKIKHLEKEIRKTKTLTCKTKPQVS